jgi:nucleotide-binding universal stress UspA family protein
MTHAIVVGYDGSEHATQAVEFAAREAQALDAPLLLVHAFTPPMGGAGLGYGTILPADALETMRDGIAVHLDADTRRFADTYPGVTIDDRVVVGNSAAALLDAAVDAQLLVVGSRGLGGFRGMLLGSTGVQIASHAPCPAVIVRGLPEPGATRVVVGLDGSELSQAALAWAFEYASRHGLTLHAVHAWTMPSFDLLAAPAGPGPADLATITAEEERSAAESLAGFTERYPEVPIEQTVIKEPATKALLDASKGAALLVVGTHGRGEIMSAVLGSVSQALLRKASIPVVVVGADQAAADIGTGT